MNLPYGTIICWRFKGEKAYRYGYPTRLSNGLIRMGAWLGDTVGGTIVSINDTEWVLA